MPVKLRAVQGSAGEHRDGESPKRVRHAGEAESSAGEHRGVQGSTGGKEGPNGLDMPAWYGEAGHSGG